MAAHTSDVSPMLAFEETSSNSFVCCCFGRGWEPVAQDEVGPRDYEGYLEFKDSKHLGGKWRRQYFVLSHGKLFYGNSADSVPANFIDLTQCIRCKSSEALAGRAYAFQVTSHVQMDLLAGSDEQNMIDWTDAIGRAMLKYSTLPPTDKIQVELKDMHMEV